MDDEKRSISTTTDGNPPAPGLEDAAAPQPVNPRTGQHAAYWVLSEEERAKGFVRPVRRSYKHVGRSVCGYIMPPADKRLGGELMVCTMELGHEGDHFTRSMQLSNPDAQRANQEHRVGGCDGVTSMSLDIAETYARKPSYYSNTWCMNCKEHLPVGEIGEFVWVDNPTERVGGTWPLPEKVEPVYGGEPTEEACKGPVGPAGEQGPPCELPGCGEQRAKPKIVNGFARRNRLDFFTPAEKAIWDAVGAVEAAGAHPLLTDAVVLLGQARSKVADYVDSQLG